ncbi:ABC transporter permease [Pseudovibrio sp. Tun.PSC04-5.I4]|uniref:ABC transporter permease n=1 Tax=Pseudovibrio sp. Tun.PSC04-5.I4 TaxID=1798213 RepID=UPI000B1AD782|nr:ABC transporter permease [Pseudovibrio sp. Tun.PSC04-5.I4]
MAQIDSDAISHGSVDAEVLASNRPSISYWGLVSRRFLRNRYGMIGLVACLLIFTTAIFAGFIAPYGPQTADRTALYSPPQGIYFFAEDGALTMPYVSGFKEEMNPQTFEISFIPDPTKATPLSMFVRGEPWQFLGLTFTTRLFGTQTATKFHILGTDNLGRDVFSRMIYGTRITLLMALMVVGAACVIGVILGVSSGYFGGLYDLVIQRLVEFIKAFPDLPLYLALVALLPRRAEPMSIFIMFACILVLLRWADLCRELRGKVFSMRNLEYVRAAEAVGASSSRIISAHIVPNTSSHIIVWTTYQLPEVILLESFLSFLGVGIQQPMVSWGSMLNQILDFQSFSAAPCVFRGHPATDSDSIRPPIPEHPATP